MASSSAAAGEKGEWLISGLDWPVSAAHSVPVLLVFPLVPLPLERSVGSWHDSAVPRGSRAGHLYLTLYRLCRMLSMDCACSKQLLLWNSES